LYYRSLYEQLRDVVFVATVRLVFIVPFMAIIYYQLLARQWFGKSLMRLSLANGFASGTTALLLLLLFGWIDLIRNEFIRIFWLLTFVSPVLFSWIPFLRALWLGET
jgi:hypothetical protein